MTPESLNAVKLCPPPPLPLLTHHPWLSPAVLALSRIPHWRDLDATVDASNAALDRAFADCDQRLRASGSRSKGLTRSTSAQLLESMREKFRPKLNELVHTSNSLKIRVQATIPGAVSGTTGGNTDAATVAKGPRDLSATL